MKIEKLWGVSIALPGFWSNEMKMWLAGKKTITYLKRVTPKNMG